MKIQMKIKNIIKVLERYNEWRRGDDSEMLEPRFIGFVIDEAIRELKKIEGKNENKH